MQIYNKKVVLHAFLKMLLQTYLHILQLTLMTVNGLSRGVPEYKRMDYTNAKINFVENTIFCSEEHYHADLCAKFCLQKIRSGGRCIGFISHSNNTCKLCEPRQSPSGSFSQINAGEAFYIFQRSHIQPDVHLNMDSSDVNTQTKNGKIIYGSAILPQLVSSVGIVDGKIGDAVHFNAKGNLNFTISEPDCFCSFAYCENNQTSIALWIKPSANHVHLAQLLTTKTRGTTIGKLDIRNISRICERIIYKFEMLLKIRIFIQNDGTNY